MDRMRLFRFWLYCESKRSRGGETLAFIQLPDYGNDEQEQDDALEQFELIFGWSLLTLFDVHSDGRLAGMSAISSQLYHPWSPHMRNTRLFEFIEHRGYTIAYIEVPFTSNDGYDREQAIARFEHIFGWDLNESYCYHCNDLLVTDVIPVDPGRYYQWPQR